MVRVAKLGMKRFWDERARENAAQGSGLSVERVENPRHQYCLVLVRRQ
jgi:hypothetical protein